MRPPKAHFPSAQCTRPSFLTLKKEVVRLRFCLGPSCMLKKFWNHAEISLHAIEVGGTPRLVRRFLAADWADCVSPVDARLTVLRGLDGQALVHPPRPHFRGPNPLRRPSRSVLGGFGPLSFGLGGFTLAGPLAYSHLFPHGLFDVPSVRLRRPSFEPEPWNRSSPV